MLGFKIDSTGWVVCQHFTCMTPQPLLHVLREKASPSPIQRLQNANKMALAFCSVGSCSVCGIRCGDSLWHTNQDTTMANGETTHSSIQNGGEGARGLWLAQQMTTTQERDWGVWGGGGWPMTWQVLHNALLYWGLSYPRSLRRCSGLYYCLLRHKQTSSSILLLTANRAPLALYSQYKGDKSNLINFDIIRFSFVIQIIFLAHSFYPFQETANICRSITQM